MHVGEVDLHRVRRAERLEDDVVVLEGLGLLLGELAGLDELVHEGLVARDLHEAIAAQDVRAAVPDLAEEEVVVDERGDRRRRAHAAARAVELRLAEDAQARRLDRVHEARGQLVVVLGRVARGHALVDDVDRELARDLAGGGAAHAVADAEQGPARADDLRAVRLHQAAALLREVRDDEVVLVVLAHLADVGPPEEAHLHLDRLPGLRRLCLRGLGLLAGLGPRRGVGLAVVRRGGLLLRLGRRWVLGGSAVDRLGRGLRIRRLGGG